MYLIKFPLNIKCYDFKKSLVGIVVPAESAVLEWTRANGFPHLRYHDLCTGSGAADAAHANRLLRQTIMKALREVAEERNLQRFEQIAAIELHCDPFSTENGLLTPTLKVKRGVALQRFATHIDRLHTLVNKVA